MSTETKKRSGAWYLLPIFFTVIGGVIAYFVIKEDDPKKAKNCLYLGILLTVIGVILSAVSAAISFA
jgi:cytochrome bd-type quinol oxidase subunit 1